MPKKTKINQKNFNFYLILIFLTIIFLVKLDFFKNLYFVITQNYEQRMVKIYGYCERDSFGFLNEIKNKYSFDENPKILNSKVLPNSDWVMFDSTKKFSKEPKIFLNYIQNPSLNFKRSSNIFESVNHVQFTDNLNSIIFDIEDNKINFKGNIKVYKKKYNKKELIFEKFIEQTLHNKKPININFKTESLNSRWEKFFIEFENTQQDQKNKIKSISLNLNNKFQFSKSQIIFSKDNCYYIK